MIFIKQKVERQSSLVDMEELRTHTVLLTNHGLKRPFDTPVHFTPAFGSPINLERDLPGRAYTLCKMCEGLVFSSCSSLQLKNMLLLPNIYLALSSGGGLQVV